MINGSYQTGLAIMLQKQLINTLFMLSPFSTLDELTQASDELDVVYKKYMPSLIFSTDKNCKVSNDALSEISTAISNTIKIAMFAHSNEINRVHNRRNVIASLLLAKKQLTEFRNLIEEAKTK